MTFEDVRKYGEPYFNRISMEDVSNEVDSAIQYLLTNYILYEGQFSFLTEGTFKHNNGERLMNMLKQHGFDSVDDLHILTFPISKIGYKYCCILMTEEFESIESIGKRVRNYYQETKG